MTEQREKQTRTELAQRITDYLSSGGLFNPEMAIHDRVRDLLIDCRDALAAEPPGRAIRCNRCQADLCEHDNCTDWTCARACSKCAQSPEQGACADCEAAARFFRDKCTKHRAAQPPEQAGEPQYVLVCGKCGRKSPEVEWMSVAGCSVCNPAGHLNATVQPGPCSPCGDGDTGMEYHTHERPDRVQIIYKSLFDSCAHIDHTTRSDGKCEVCWGMACSVEHDLAGAAAGSTTVGAELGIHAGAIAGGQCGHVHAYESSSSYLNCSLHVGHVGRHKDGHNSLWDSGDISELRGNLLYAKYRLRDAELDLKARERASTNKGGGGTNDATV